MTEVELGPKAFWLLAAAGVLSGMASVWAFRRWSDTVQLRTAANRVIAHLFELRLFSDEPVVILRAQRDLLKANGEFLRLVTGPSLFLLLPFAVLLAGLDAVFAHASLQIGRPAVITLRYRRPAGGVLPEAQIDAPPGIRIETLPVRISAASEISWRLRPVRPVKGKLWIQFNGHSFTKSISSVPGLQWLSDSRAGSRLAFLRHPLELPFSGTEVNLIAVQYPFATVLNRRWPVWFSLAFLGGALAYSLAAYHFFSRISLAVTYLSY